MADKGSELNIREDRFCRQYVRHVNATKAAIKAGYSKKTAYSQGHELLKKPEIAARIRELQEATARRLEIRTDKVLLELATIAFMDMDDFGTWDEDGTFTPTPSVDLLPEQTKCVAEFTCTESNGKKTLKFKLHSKTAALDRLCKHLGLDQERPALDVLLDSLPREIADQLKGILAAVLAAKMAPSGASPSPPKEPTE